MSLYVKRSTYVEAIQWFPPGDMRHIPVPGIEHEVREGKSIYLCHTETGYRKIDPGDYIVTESEHGQYPCKPDVFEKSFRPSR